MSAWDAAQLALLSESFSLRLSAGDAGLEVEIGMVVTGGCLYVRAQRGAASAWYRAAIAAGRGSVRVGAQSFAVVFAAADPALMPEIDAAYRAKYGALASFANSPLARAGTLLVTPA